VSTPQNVKRRETKNDRKTQNAGKIYTNNTRKSTFFVCASDPDPHLDCWTRVFNRNAVSNPAGEKKFVSKNVISWSQGFSWSLEVLHGSLRIFQ
jgi:hypothetical protein